LKTYILERTIILKTLRASFGLFGCIYLTSNLLNNRLILKWLFFDVVSQKYRQNSNRCPKNYSSRWHIEEMFWPDSVYLVLFVIYQNKYINELNIMILKFFENFREKCK
jgi:hypothetical protein